MTTPTCVLLQSMRSVLLKNTVPPPRLEIVSPYTNTTPSEEPQPGPLYTKKQLDMRRKYEILQYKNTSTVNGRITKNAAYSRLMSGNKNRYTITVETNNKQVIYSANSCPDDEIMAVPTTSSDVPGTKEIIYYDPKVPLYNFGYNENNYSFLPKTFDINNTTEVIFTENIALDSESFTTIMNIIYLQDYSHTIDQITIIIAMELRADGTKQDPSLDSYIKLNDFVSKKTTPVTNGDSIDEGITITTNLDEHNFLIYEDSTDETFSCSYAFNITLTLKNVNITELHVYNIESKPYLSSTNIQNGDIKLLANTSEPIIII
tara:strand:+ start:615 stop:1568 length:954 start_codon:yes stop_codon:yes gene_type:complete